MTDVIFRPAAATDAQQAFQWYEHEQEKLAEEFLAELDRVLDLISDNPQLFPRHRRETRRASASLSGWSTFY